MKCANHPEKDAVGVCVSCGTGVCADCRNVVRGATYCEDCLKTHEPMRVFPGGDKGHGINMWAVIAWILAIVGWWPGLEFVSIGGILLGFVALGDIRARDYTQSGRAYAYAAIACGTGGLAVKLVWFFYLLHAGVVSSVFDAYKYLGM
jgi:hypothetical protein